MRLTVGPAPSTDAAGGIEMADIPDTQEVFYSQPEPYVLLRRCDSPTNDVNMVVDLTNESPLSSPGIELVDDNASPGAEKENWEVSLIF